jgi:hypothetical protein
MTSRRWLRRTLLAINVLIALVTLASACGILASSLLEPGYREAHRDPLWFVVAYAGVQVVVLAAFARDTWLVPWLALGKALLAYLFLATFVVAGTYWMAWTPGRYLYQLFDAETSKVGLFALAFLGRGTWNTANALYFTAPWWLSFRNRRPLVGRLLTAIAFGVMGFSVWAFLQLVHLEQQAFSPEAYEIASVVYDGLDCDAIRAHDGHETSDIRLRGERHYEVRIAYDCHYTTVWVRAEDGRRGSKSGPRIECCAEQGK